MMLTRYSSTLYLATLISALWICFDFPSAEAQNNPNTITFDNKSGEPALVNLIGPTAQTVNVPQGETRTVNVAPGKYHILVRYDRKTDTSYSKGNPFIVEQTATQYSAISITLHKVVGGNYRTHRISREEFDKAIIGATTVQRQIDTTSLKETFAIKDVNFIDRSIPDGNESNVEVMVEGKNLKLTAPTPGGLILFNGKVTTFANGSTNTWIGTDNSIFGYVFNSDKDDPLQFRVDKDKGYVYVKGKGTVITPDGKEVKLPRD